MATRGTPVCLGQGISTVCLCPGIRAPSNQSGSRAASSSRSMPDRPGTPRARGKGSVLERAFHRGVGRKCIDVETDRAVQAVSPLMKGRLVATLTVLAVATACSGQSGTPSVIPSTGSPATEAPSAPPVTDYSSFIDGLEAAGFDVRQGEPILDGTLFGPGQSVFIDGVRVSTYEYPTEEALDEFRGSVRDHGYAVPVKGGVAHVDWIAPPHFFAEGKLLVLYLRQEQRTLDALDLLFGRPFAGETGS